LERDYAFTVYDNRLITLSNIRDNRCELRKFADAEEISAILRTDIPDHLFAELLNQTLLIFAKQRDLMFHPRAQMVS
jgi:hypothetical protein